MLVITGAGRCGTSLLAKFCSEMGYNLNSNEWFDDINAGMECEISIYINQSLIDNKIPDDNLVDTAKVMDNCVIKDPRFLHSIDVVSYWYNNIRKDLKYLVLDRDFKNIVKSQKKAFDNPYDIQESIDELKKYYKKFEENCEKYDIEREYGMEFPYFLENYDLVHDKLTRFGELNIDYDEGKEKWNSLVDVDKVHYK